MYFLRDPRDTNICAKSKLQCYKKWSTNKFYHSPVDIIVALRVETGAVHRRHRCLTCCIVLKTMAKSCTITRCTWCRNARGDLSTSLERVQTILRWNICLVERSNLYSASRISTWVINFSVTWREKTFLVKKDGVVPRSCDFHKFHCLRSSIIHMNREVYLRCIREYG